MIHFNRIFFEEDTGGNATTGTAPETPSTGGSLADFAPAPDGQPTKTASQERLEGETLPDFSGLGKKKAAEAPKPEAAKPAETKPEKPQEKSKPAEEKKLPEIPKGDKDLDALQPKPNAPQNIVKSFSELRAIAARERSSARAYQAELENARKEAAALKEASGKLPPEVEQELEGLRKFNLLFQAENDPAFKKEYTEKIAAAETGIFSLLARHGLSDTIVEEIKSAAKADKGNIESWPRWAELVNAFTNPLDRQEIIDALKARRDAIGAKQTKLSELGQSKEKFMAAVEERQKSEQLEFAWAVEKKSIDLAAANDWILEQEIPANADENQRSVLEAKNAEVKKRADAFSGNVRAVYSRDPDKTAEVALKAVEADYLREQNAELTTERDKAVARNRELEAQLAKIKNAGRLAHIETPSEKASERKTTGEEGKVGGDGSSAIRNFFANRK